MTTAILQSRLAAVKNVGHFDATAVGSFARYIAEAPDEKLFRMNPYRYAEETGTPERLAVDLFLHAAHAGVVEFSWGVLCPGCGSFITTDHALRALNEDRFCAICEIPIPPVIDDNVEVTFSVAPSARTIRFHTPEKLDFLRDSLPLFFSPSVADTTHIGRYLDNPVWFGTAPAGAKLETETELAPGATCWRCRSTTRCGASRSRTARARSASNYEVLAGGELIQEGDQLAAGKVRMTLQNRLGRPVVFGAFTDPRPSSPEALAEKAAKLAHAVGLELPSLLYRQGAGDHPGVPRSLPHREHSLAGWPGAEEPDRALHRSQGLDRALLSHGRHARLRPRRRALRHFARGGRRARRRGGKDHRRRGDGELPDAGAGARSSHGDEPRDRQGWRSWSSRSACMPAPASRWT